LDERLALLSSRFPGLSVAERGAVLNAQAQLNTAQNSYANNLLIGVIAILAAVTLVNTLVMAIVGRRDSLRLLGLSLAGQGDLGWRSRNATRSAVEVLDDCHDPAIVLLVAR
jgi:hypothetical protein